MVETGERTGIRNTHQRQNGVTKVPPFSTNPFQSFISTSSSRCKEEAEEEIELSLGLSLNGRFGLDPKAKNSKLTRSSSIPEDLINKGKEQHENGERTCFIPGLSMSLSRTCSLPVETAEEWRKRKEMQSLRRLEAKRKRSEKMRAGMEFHTGGNKVAGVKGVKGCGENYHFAPGGVGGENGSSESYCFAPGLVGSSESYCFAPGLVGGGRGGCMVQQANGEKGRSENDDFAPGWVGGGRTGCMVQQASVEKGLTDPGWFAGGEVEAMGEKVTLCGGGSNGASPGSTGSSGVTEIESQQRVLGTNNSSETRSPTSVQSSPKAKPTTAGTPEEKNQPKRQEVVGKAGVGDMARNMVQSMPCVFARGDGPNGKRVEGFLYRYNKGEEVRIVCVCHGSFLSPAEFVKHAGGGDVLNPLRHIVVSTSTLF